MFRELTRRKQQLPAAACIDVLKNEKRGVLSVLGDDGYPYGMPMNHFYNEADGKLYFHCGKHGHRTDALRRCEKASFCVTDGGRQTDGDWALRFNSVIVFGTVSFIEDPAVIADLTAKLSRKFTDDEAYIRQEIEKFGPATVLLCLTPAHISGKSVTES